MAVAVAEAVPGQLATIAENAAEKGTLIFATAIATTAAVSASVTETETGATGILVAGALPSADLDPQIEIFETVTAMFRHQSTSKDRVAVPETVDPLPLDLVPPTRHSTVLHFRAEAASCAVADAEGEATGALTEVEDVPPTTTAMIAILGAGLRRAAGVAENTMTETEEIGIPKMAAETSAMIATDPIENTYEGSLMPARPTRQTRHPNRARFRRLPSPLQRQHLVQCPTEDRYPLTVPASHLLCLGHIAIARPLRAT